MKNLLLAGLISLVVSLILGIITIPVLRKIKFGQPILKYVETHKDKNGTPTMGGLFFIISAVLVFLLFGGFSGRVSTVSVAIGLAFMLVGFIDDFIKVKFGTNQGLKSYQKIIFQLAIAITAGFFAYVNRITLFHIPFTNLTVDFGFFTIPVIVLIFIAMTNSVNLTDGLDGLAGSVSVAYLISIILLISTQISNSSMVFLGSKEYSNLNLLSACLIGAILGFLFFNVNKAKVFMGDTGSLSLGGFLAGISVFSLNSLFIPIVGIMFVLSSISVIVQVFHFKRTKKRVFLMAPLHHHFQLKGNTESKIAYCYTLITFVMGGLCIIFAI